MQIKTVSLLIYGRLSNLHVSGGQLLLGCWDCCRWNPIGQFLLNCCSGVALASFVSAVHTKRSTTPRKDEENRASRLSSTSETVQEKKNVEKKETRKESKDRGMINPVLEKSKPETIPKILVSDEEPSATKTIGTLFQTDSSMSLELEGDDGVPVRMTSSMPESRPSGLVAIRFFNNATSPALVAPSLGTAGTVNTPKLPSIRPSTFNVKPPNVYLPMMPMPFVQRRSADDIPPAVRAPVKQLAGVKRGRGRPRTRSTDQNDGMPPAHMMTVMKPSQLMPKPSMIPPPPPEFLASHLGKLPRLAPRPNMAVPVAMIQPNTLQQTRSLMRSSVGAGLPSPALSSKSLSAPHPAGSTRSFSADAQTPEMAVLRLISDACDIRESSRSSADPLPNPAAMEKPKVTKTRGRAASSTARKLAPRLDSIKALQSPAPPKIVSKLSSSNDPNQIRKILPRPPSNKLPLPIAPRHRQP